MDRFGAAVIAGYHFLGEKTKSVTVPRIGSLHPEEKTTLHFLYHLSPQPRKDHRQTHLTWLQLSAMFFNHAKARQNARLTHVENQPVSELNRFAAQTPAAINAVLELPIRC